MRYLSLLAVALFAGCPAEEAEATDLCELFCGGGFTSGFSSVDIQPVFDTQVVAVEVPVFAGFQSRSSFQPGFGGFSGFSSFGRSSFRGPEFGVGNGFRRSFRGPEFGFGRSNFNFDLNISSGFNDRSRRGSSRGRGSGRGGLLGGRR